MSNARWPPFRSPDKAACSRKMSAGPRQANAAPWPSRRATPATAHQSGRASPAGGRNARCRLIIRSLFVTVPHFSPQARAGSRTWARSAVSLSATASDTTTRSHPASARRTRPASGIDTAGLVAMIQIALTRPSSTARNRSTAFSPGPAARFGAPQ